MTEHHYTFLLAAVLFSLSHDSQPAIELLYNKKNDKKKKKYKYPLA
jgi:hypothetical protein